MWRSLACFVEGSDVDGPGWSVDMGGLGSHCEDHLVDRKSVV